MSDQEGATMDSTQSAVYISNLQSEHMLPINRAVDIVVKRPDLDMSHHLH
jgi:hypothetical protein